MPELPEGLPAKAKPRQPRRYRPPRLEPLPCDPSDPRQTTFDFGWPKVGRWGGDLSEEPWPTSDNR
jgi:hypothetical protein